MIAGRGSMQILPLCFPPRLRSGLRQQPGTATLTHAALNAAEFQSWQGLAISDCWHMQRQVHRVHVFECLMNHAQMPCKAAGGLAA